MDDGTKAYNCYNDPNYTEEGLKKCQYQKNRYDIWSICNICSNQDICPGVVEKKDVTSDAWLELLNSIELTPIQPLDLPTTTSWFF